MSGKTPSPFSKFQIVGDDLCHHTLWAELSDVIYLSGNIGQLVGKDCYPLR